MGVRVDGGVGELLAAVEGSRGGVLVDFGVTVELLRFCLGEAMGHVDVKRRAGKEEKRKLKDEKERKRRGSERGGALGDLSGRSSEGRKRRCAVVHVRCGRSRIQEERLLSGRGGTNEKAGR